MLHVSFGDKVGHTSRTAGDVDAMSPRSTKFILFEASLFIVEQLALFLSLLTAALMIGPAANHVKAIGGAVSVPSWPEFGIAAGLLVLPLWMLIRGAYRQGTGVPAERLRQRVQAGAIIGSSLAVAWMAGSAPDRDLILLMVGLGAILIIGLAMEGTIRPLLGRIMRVNVPAMVCGSALFHQRVNTLLKAGADFGGLTLDRPVHPDGQDKPHLQAQHKQAKLQSRGTSAPPPIILAIPEHAAAGRLQAHDLGGFLAISTRPEKPGLFSRVAKLVLDKLVATIAVLALLPVFLLIALSIRVFSTGPALYAQTRTGLNGKTFKVWKFRTMRLDAERVLQEHLEANPEAKSEWQRFFKLKQDPRIIPGIGNFLRRSSLDELPQLFNILTGDMSLVGPRPFPSYHLDQFRPEFQRLRATVKPGLTGFWQISARSSGDLTVQEMLDTYYVRNASIWLDLYIIAHTPFAMLAGRGAY